MRRMKVMKHTLSWLTLIVTVTFVVSPALTSPSTGFTADQLPVPQINPPIQPAGYAFSIWGLIYGWLLVSAIYGVAKRPDDAAWDAVRLPLIISLAVGTPWLWIANQSAIWATITIFIMAFAAIWALLRSTSADRWWLQTPVAIYAGWLTAASFVSLGSTAAGYGIMFTSLGWAFAGISFALAVALWVLSRKPVTGYGATMIWALVGLIAANGANGVTALAAFGIVVLAAATLSWRRPPA